MPPAQANPPLRLVASPGPAGTGGESGSIEALFREHSAYVAGLAYKLLGRNDEVDDVVQDVFIGAMRGLSSLREPGAARGWLATVTVRMVGRRLRWRKVAHFFGSTRPAEEYERVASAEASPEQRALLARVYAVLDELPVPQRMAWTLRHVEGERLEAVAAACGCSLATAKRRIAAAQDFLEQVMSDEAD